jgi:hypothetical protein
METLRHFGIRELKPGQKLRIRYEGSERGPYATFLELVREESPPSSTENKGINPTL